MYFREWKVLYFDPNFTEIFSFGFNWQQVSIGSGDGLETNSQQAITFTNDGVVQCCIDAALGGRWVNFLGPLLTDVNLD